MPQRVLCTALVTANVFQNVLARHDPRCQYYTDLLRRLTGRSVDWCMTHFDWDLAWNSWDLFSMEIDTECQHIYMGMLHLVSPCAFDESILELSGDFQINFYDALRLATAIDRNVDVIVTQEPRQFVRSYEEDYRVQMDGYFYLTLPTECADTGMDREHRVGVFSVGSFLLNLDQIKRRSPVRSHRLLRFQIEQFRLISGDHNEASISVRCPKDLVLAVTARGSTAFDAIQRAIDQAVDQCCDIPCRRLIRFSTPTATLTGADSPVEIVIGVGCGDLHFEQSACSGNWMRAAADAYIKVINSICDHLSPSIGGRSVELPSDPL